MSEYVESFYETKYKSLVIKVDELLKKYNIIWDKASNGIKKGFDSDCRLTIS